MSKYISYVFAGHDYDYELKLSDIDAALIYYFDKNDVRIDGTRTDVFNVLAELNVIDKILDDEDVEVYLKKICEEKAYEMFLYDYEEEDELREDKSE